MFADAVCLISDATTLADEEKTAIIARVMSRDLCLQQRAVAIEATAHHVSGVQDAALLEAALKRLHLVEMKRKARIPEDTKLKGGP